MPRQVSEVTSGAQFSRSSQAGVAADSQTRVFKILLEQPGEVVDLQDACDVFIGDAHPYNTNIFCQAFSASFDGDSRMVLVCRFDYASTPGGGGEDPKSVSPDIRPANWSTSSSLIEVPVQAWRLVNSAGVAGSATAASNPVGDMYDGVARLEAVVVITVEQREPEDPTRHTLYVGSVNAKPLQIGSLKCPTGTVMFRGVSSKPTVESWGSRTWRGWVATYEFAYRRNSVSGITAENPVWESTEVVDADIGWDIAVPQTGFNVIAFDPNSADGRDVYGQPLAHDRGKTVDPPELPPTVSAGDRVRAMVKVFSYEDKGASQLPSAQPIPLNDDGTPRAVSANPKVIVKRYRTLPEIDFSMFGLRLT